MPRRNGNAGPRDGSDRTEAARVRGSIAHQNSRRPSGPRRMPAVRLAHEAAAVPDEMPVAVREMLYTAGPGA